MYASESVRSPFFDNQAAKSLLAPILSTKIRCCNSWTCSWACCTVAEQDACLNWFFNKAICLLAAMSISPQSWWFLFRWTAVRLYRKGTKLHFKSPMAERRHVVCVGVGVDRTHAARPGGEWYAILYHFSHKKTFKLIHIPSTLYLEPKLFKEKVVCF